MADKCNTTMQQSCDKQFDAIHERLESSEKDRKQRHELFFKLLDNLDKHIRGNGRLGILTRLNLIEQRNAIKDRIKYMLFGAALTAVVGLIVKLIWIKLGA